MQLKNLTRFTIIRASPLVQQYQQLIKNNKVRQKSLGSRFILIHTFAHLLINHACEEFNRFLDRAVVVGKVENRALGYFDINVHLRE